ncbi:hypothetical protein [Simkania sp.]|uniref:hypothetical protein n=1 Tax=Simkania sp. TaxID=34094 RepID=UPI003B51897D
MREKETCACTKQGEFRLPRKEVRERIQNTISQILKSLRQVHKLLEEEKYFEAINIWAKVRDSGALTMLAQYGESEYRHRFSPIQHQLLTAFSLQLGKLKDVPKSCEAELVSEILRALQLSIQHL